MSAGAHACFQVVDNGPGVAKADRDKVVKRFARLDRSRNTSGYGLGLNLVAAVAKLHGGRLLSEGCQSGTVGDARSSGLGAEASRRMTTSMTDRELAREALSKVPAVTLGFWIIKILATTLGETGGDSVTMSWLGETTAHPVPNGYLIGTAMFGVLLVGLVWAQIRAKTFNPWLYWATIVASTTCGTTLADFADRSLGIGYPGGSLLLLACVLAVAVRLASHARHGQRQHDYDGHGRRAFTG